MKRRKYGVSLKRVERRFDRWRFGRSSRKERIPTELWGLAVEAAKEHGVCAVSKALHIEYNALKRRLGDMASAKRGQAKRAAFVEVLPSVMSCGECSLEISTGSGRRLLMRFPMTATPELLVLTRELMAKEQREEAA